MGRPRILTDEERLNHKRESQRKYLKTDRGKVANKKARDVWKNTPNGYSCVYNCRKNYYERTQHLTQGRRIWTCEEDELIFNFIGTDEELAHKIVRSVAAIQMRRYRLRKGGNNR